MAAVAVSSAAVAQVTLSGSITARYQNSNITGAAADKFNGFHFSDSEIVVSASEDLGGGLKATASMSVEGLSEGAGGKGGGTVLGLSGGFGSVVFSNKGSSDYLPVDGEVTNSKFSNGSVDDRVTYTSPKIGGASLSVTYQDGNGNAGTGTEPGSSRGSTSTVYELNYSAGPLTANVGVLSVDKNTHALFNGGNRVRVGYNFGVAAVTYGQVNTKDNNDLKRKETGLTISAPLGAITASYQMATSKIGTAAALDGTQLNLAYALSKRTSLSFTKIDYDASASVKNAEIHEVSLNHSF